MLAELLQFDENLFLFINGLHIPLFDNMSPYYRHKLAWAPLYVFLISFFLINYGRRGGWVILFALITVGITDTASSQWIKKSVKRLRPCNTVELQDQMTLRVRCGSGYSFTSSHATNHTGLAFFFFYILGKPRSRWQWLLLLWAVSIGLAQIYVGVHYPLDVLCGTLLGAAIGWLSGRVFLRYIGLGQIRNADPPDLETNRQSADVA